MNVVFLGFNFLFLGLLVCIFSGFFIFIVRFMMKMFLFCFSYILILLLYFFVFVVFVIGCGDDGGGGGGFVDGIGIVGGIDGVDGMVDGIVIDGVDMDGEVNVLFFFGGMYWLMLN